MCKRTSFLRKHWKKFALHHITIFSFYFFISKKVESPGDFFFHFHSFFMHVWETKHLIRSSITAASQSATQSSPFSLCFSFPLSFLLFIQVHFNYIFVSYSHIIFQNPEKYNNCHFWVLSDQFCCRKFLLLRWLVSGICWWYARYEGRGHFVGICVFKWVYKKPSKRTHGTDPQKAHHYCTIINRCNCLSFLYRNHYSLNLWPKHWSIQKMTSLSLFSLKTDLVTSNS